MYTAIYYSYTLFFLTIVPVVWICAVKYIHCYVVFVSGYSATSRSCNGWSGSQLFSFPALLYCTRVSKASSRAPFYDPSVKMMIWMHVYCYALILATRAINGSVSHIPCNNCRLNHPRTGFRCFSLWFTAEPPPSSRHRNRLYPRNLPTPVSVRHT